MIQIRRSHERGHARTAWLDSRHSFSFGEYHDPEYMGVSNLRVINDDQIAAGGGFPTHGHRDMEIITYVLDGALEHKDSMGNGSVMRPGDVQRMSAGRGVRHSEFNPSPEEPTRLLQIWLTPNKIGVEPAYDQRHFDPGERRDRLRLLVSPDGRDDSIATHQDALLYGTLLRNGPGLSYRLSEGRSGYVHVARGSAEVNGEALDDGDAAILQAEREVRLEGIDDTEILLFDLP